MKKLLLTWRLGLSNEMEGILGNYFTIFRLFVNFIFIIIHDKLEYEMRKFNRKIQKLEKLLSNATLLKILTVHV